jgi:hypothetical protein
MENNLAIESTEAKYVRLVQSVLARCPRLLYRVPANRAALVHGILTLLPANATTAEINYFTAQVTQAIDLVAETQNHSWFN